MPETMIAVTGTRGTSFAAFFLSSPSERSMRDFCNLDTSEDLHRFLVVLVKTLVNGVCNGEEGGEGKGEENRGRSILG